MIAREVDALFVHVPKNAGQAVEYASRERLGSSESSVASTRSEGEETRPLARSHEAQLEQWGLLRPPKGVVNGCEVLLESSATAEGSQHPSDPARHR